jgi:hypothetical protein
MKKGTNIVLESADCIGVDIRKRDLGNMIAAAGEDWSDQVLRGTFQKGESWFWSAGESMKGKLAVLYDTRTNTRADQRSFETKSP